MQKHNCSVKALVVIIFSLFFQEFLFGQKTLDHKLFLEKIKHSNDNIYKECIKEYNAYLNKFPNDVYVLIEKCKFIQYAQFDEDEYINPNQAEFDSCVACLINRFPAHPEVLLFQTTYLWDDQLREVLEIADKSTKENPKLWNDKSFGAFYNAKANYFYYQDDYKQAVKYFDIAIYYDEQYNYSLDYADALSESGKKEKALSVLVLIPDTAKEAWGLNQKANLLLKLKAYSEALNIYSKVEQIDSTYINNSKFASTLEGIGEYELARKYLVDDTVESYDNKKALLRLLNHDLKYQDGSKCIASYNAFRDLGYLSDPISLHRLKLFFYHPTQPWTFRDLLGLASLLILLTLLIILPYIWILPVYFAGKRFKFLSPKQIYESPWGLKMFWFVSTGYLLASLFASIVEPEALYFQFNSSGFNYETDIYLRNIGFESLVFIIIMALVGIMAMYKVNAKILLSTSYSIRKSMRITLGAFIIYRIISGIYFLLGGKLFNISIDELACIPQILLTARQDIGAMISTFGTGTSIMLVCLLAPIYEEIIFRGVILGSCQRHINFNVANIFQALLFSIVHGDLFLLPVFFLCGMLSGILRKKSGGLLLGIIFHILNNIAAMIIYIR